MDKVNEFRKIANGLANLYKQKNIAYGDSFGISIKKYGLISALTRISDKFNRLEQLILSKTKGNKIDIGDEKLKDTILDMASYCIMTAMELDSMENKDNK